MKNLRRWFTLVELIVVITILAILGTIAFISLQGYSADARNSKRTNDLTSLSTSVTVKTTEGISILTFVTTSDPTSAISNPSIGGAVANSTEYKAGDVDYSTLGLKPSDFKDPTFAVPYKIGATTKNKGKYEFAAKIEAGAGTYEARILGNWFGRSDTNKGSFTSTGVITLTAAEVNAYYVGDIVSDGTNTGAVTAISSDGLTIRTGVNVAPTGSGKLAAAETTGLIKSTTSTGTGIVSDGSRTELPY